MEAQPIIHPLVSKLFLRFNPHPALFQELDSYLLKNCRGTEEGTRELLAALEATPPAQINFDSFCKIIRLLRRTVLPFKNEQLSLRLGRYVSAQAHLYFPIGNSVATNKFGEFLKLFAGVPVEQPASLGDQQQVLIYLSRGKVEEQWGASLVEKINNEVLVDRKNQQARALKVNQYFSAFLVAHFEQLFPQLERLLVRSESNLEVWEDFFASVGEWSGLDATVVPLLNKIKHLFINNAETSIKIVVAVSRRLQEENSIKAFISFLTGLISNEQNVKRKVVYIRMLKGVTEALARHPEEKVRNLYAQEVIVVLLNGLIKFTEEEEFNLLTGVFESLCPLVTDPKDDMAKAGKLYLKNNNKYIFILFSTVIASVYRKEHVDRLPSVKEIFTHFKTQLPAILKTNWQCTLPVLHFLSEYDLQFIDHLSEGAPLFKVSCLALSKIEKKIGLRLILKYVQFVRQSEDEEFSNGVYAILSLLLEEVKDRSAWEHLIASLDVNERVKLVARGIFPLTLFPCPELKINRGNSFTSLLLFLYRSLGKQNVTVPSGLDFIRSIIVYSQLQPSLKETLRTEENAVMEEAIREYVNSSLLGRDGEEERVVSEREGELIEVLSNEILSHHQDYLIQLLQNFTNEDYYKKNLQFLIDFEQEALQSAKKVRKQLHELRDELVELGICKAEEGKARRVYVGVGFQAKMMSEEEVKEEKYRVHFLKMLGIFDRITAKLLCTLNSHPLVCHLWQAHLKSILAVTKFPEHRLSVQKLVTRSCLFTAWFNRNSPQSRIFSKHSGFLGEFLAFRHSKITPSVKTMTHCEEFLRELLGGFEGGAMLATEGQFVMLLVNEVCEYLLENMEFDVNLKKLAIQFYHQCGQRGIVFANADQLFAYLARNINILAHSDHIQPVLLRLLGAVDRLRIKELFDDILNYIQATKRLILQTITQFQHKYRPEFEEFIKLRILALEANQEISGLAGRILAEEGDLKKSILGFNMKNFVKKNSKETIEKLCLFIKEEITPETCQSVFHMVIRASEELFDEGFDQEGLEMFPFFLNINLDYITEPLYRPVFELLILKFTAKEDFRTLTKLSVDVGISIIKRNADAHAEKLLLVLESFINKATGVSNIIYLGVLAPYLEGNKNLQIIEKRITELFKGEKENEQRAISKCMPDLMSFFKEPLKIVDSIYENIGTMTPEWLQVGQSYLFSGLLKGIGYSDTQRYLDRIIASDYVAKTKGEKLGRIHLVNALVENFGRVVELKGVSIISIMLGYMADNVAEIREVSKKVGQSLIVKMSSYSVKILLPELLKGLEEEQNWRIKISYIWILGIMANCSARQLQTSLPIIVPTLSTCLSNAHPTIREKASEALNLIGETIKNPEISQCVDILIEALENPFDNSERALEILLKTSFSHFIDAPSLSMIIPILDYCMRGRVSDLKAGSCQVIGSIVELIANPYDLLPYLRIIITGLKVALCDPLPEIRSIAAMAIGRISTKIGIKEAEIYFKFVLDIIESPQSNTTERQGAAQAYAEMICSQTYEYFEESLYKIFEKLNAVSHSEKEGYILVFLYVPSIRTQEFEGFIKEVNENMYCFVSDEDESIRNSAMMVERVLISNYCLSHTDLLLDPLCNGVFENNWKKRNSALVLIGEMLNIIKSYIYNTRAADKTYAYYRGLMAVYIIKDDELEMPRLTANQVWNAYIENTPKTIKLGLNELAKMWTRWTHSANGVVFKNIIAFSGKYGENYFPEILEHLQKLLKEPDHQVGVFEVLTEFIKRLNLQYLSKESFRQTIRTIFSDHLFTIPESVRPSLARSLALFIDKMHEETFFEDLLYSTIEKMDHTDETNEEYTKSLHLLKDLLQTNSNKVVDRVINKIMEAPMSEFKIEVITNNAERLANYLYSHFKVPATELFIEEIYQLVEDKAKENRLSLIIYCLEQVSLQLNKKNKAEFIKMINTNIRKGINNYSEHQDSKTLGKTLEIFINMLLFFLNSTQISQIDELESIIGQLSPLIFFQNPVLKSLGHKIFLLLISDNKSQQTSFYIRQMVVSLENNISSPSQVVWEDEVTFKDYVNMLVKGIAYGREDIMEESLDMFEFIMGHTPKELVEREILRIVGPIIRISNYPLLQKQKIRIMELLITILKQSFKIDAYNNQILSVCLRILQEFRNSEDVMRVVGDTYLALLTGTSLKQELILNILGKLKSFGANLVHSFYYMVKSIIVQSIELPKSLYEKICQECMAILLANEGKLPIKGLYYASKIAARLSVFMGRSIERAEANLKGLVCSYESVIHYLHFAYYKKIAIVRHGAIEVFLKESNREKVHYLLKSLKLCIKNSQEARKTFSLEYVRAILPENITGFDDISDLIDYFESEKTEQVAESEIVE